jgi:archaellum component FlaG (FlaF/FlaG flagellin family)
MAAPNSYGSNLTKAQIALLIDEDGNPIGSDNPASVEIIIDGEPVSAANPVPVVIV